MLKEFKEFAMRGNVVDMGVGIVIGAAFGAVVTSFVGDVLMPVLGMLTGGVDFSNLFLLLREGKTAAPYASLAAAREAGAVVVGYGALVNTAVNFAIVAFALFLLIKGVASTKRQEATTPPPPAPPSKEEILLAQIRDLLARR